MNEVLQVIVDRCQAWLGLSAERLADVVLTVAAWVLVMLVRYVVGRVLERRIPDVQRRYPINKTLNYILGFIFVIATLMIWFGGLTGWSAYLGLVSAGLAIALRDPLVNFVAWIFINFRKPFVVGDRIEVGGLRGDVIDVRLFAFSVIEIGNWVDADQSTGRIIHVPNGVIFHQHLANYTAGFRFIWDEVAVMITFESDWRRAKAILTEIAERHSAIRDEDAAAEVRRASRQYMVSFRHLTPIVWTSVADSGAVLTLRYICEPRQRRSTSTAIWEDILTAFAAEDGIDFAYPSVRYYDNAAEGKPGAGGPPRGV